METEQQRHAVLADTPVVEREPKQDVQVATVQVAPAKVWWEGEMATVESEGMSYINLTRHAVSDDKDYGDQGLAVPTAELPHLIALLQDLAKR